MNIKSFIRLLLLLILNAAAFSTAAFASATEVQLYNTQIGSPDKPENLKLCLTLPESYKNTAFTADDLSVYIYPEALNVKTGRNSTYKADKLLLWQYQNRLFLDIRKPPEQRNEGNCTVYLELQKNKHVIFKTEVKEKVNYTYNETDVVLIIDSSLSMRKNDPDNTRLAAAKAFVDFARADKGIRNIAIIAFNNNTKIIAGLTPARNSRRLHNAIEQIGSGGQTDIGSALEKGLEVLNFAKSKRTAVVLLTDGKNESLPYANQHADFIRLKIPVYCIGLSDNADTGLLQQIARETDAKYFQTSNSSDLLGIYQRIASTISRRKIIFNKLLNARENRITIPVDNTLENISFVLNARENEAELVLINPAGKIFDSKPRQYETYQEIRIDKPEAGLWSAVTRRHSNNRDFEINVTGDTALYLDSFPPIINNNTVWLCSTLASNGDPVNNSQVHVISYKGQKRLYDDGKHNDSKADDGIYTCSFPLLKKDDFKLFLRAWGTNNLPYLRQSDIGVVTASAITLQEEPISYSLTASAEDTDNSVYAGNDTAQDITLQFSGKPEKLRAEFSGLHNSVYTIPAENLTFSLTELRNGDNYGVLKIRVPSQVPEGKYTGTVSFITEHTQALLPVEIAVTEPELIIEENIINLGRIREGESREESINLILKSGQDETVQLLAVNSAFNIEYNRTTLTPDTPATVKFRVTAKKNTAATEQRGKIIVQTENTYNDLIIDYSIIPAVNEYHTLCMSHELSPALPVEKISTNIFTHELSFVKPAPLPVSIRQETSLFVHEILPPEPVTIALPNKIEKPVPPAITEVQTEKINSRNINTEINIKLILIIIGTLAAVLFCLAIRKACQHKMLRFALLSLIIHLPITAFIASYIIVTQKLPEQITQTETAFNLTENSDRDFITENAITADTGAEFIDSEDILADLPEMNNTADSVSELSLLTQPQPDSDDTLTAFNDNSSAAGNMLSDESSFTIPAISRKNDRIIKDTGYKNSELTDNTERLQPVFASTAVDNNSVSPELPVLKTAEVVLDDTTDTFSSAAKAITEDSAVNKIDTQDNLFTDFAELTADNTEIKIPVKNYSADIAENTDYTRITNNNSMHYSTTEPINTADSLQRELSTDYETAEALSRISNSVPEEQHPDQLLTSIASAAPLERPATLPALTAELSSFNDNAEISLIIPEEETETPDTVLFETEAYNNNISAIEINTLEDIPTITNNSEFHKDSVDPAAIQPAERVIAQTYIADLDSIPEITANTADSYEITIADNPEIKTAPSADFENMNILEQTIDLPEKNDSFNIIPEEEDKPTIISSIDTLDIAIDEKLSHLQDTDNINSPDLSRKQDSSKYAAAEEYIPSIPAVTELSADRKPLNTPEIISELSDNESADISIIASSAADDDIAIPAITEKEDLLDSQKPAVSITNTPAMLKVEPVLPANIQKNSQTVNNDSFSGTDSVINTILIKIGLFVNQESRYGDIPQSENITKNFIDINLDDLSSYQFIIVNKEALSPAEITILINYVKNGGYLWIQDQGIPVEFSILGKIQHIRHDTAFFNSTYKIQATELLFAERIDNDNTGSVIATGCRNNITNTSLMQNIFDQYFGNPDRNSGSAEIATQSYNTKISVWQNFSGIAQDMLGWKGPKWGNPVLTSLAPDGNGGEALRVSVKPGDADFTSVNYIIPDYEGRRINLTDNKEIVLDIYNASRKLVELSLGLTTNSQQNGWDEFETKKVQIKSGWNRNVIIPLKNFRSRKNSQNDYTHELAAADNCARVSLYLSNIRDGGTFLIDNIKWTE